MRKEHEYNYFFLKNKIGELYLYDYGCFKVKLCHKLLEICVFIRI